MARSIPSRVPGRHRSLLILLAVTALAACVNVEYARRSERIEPRAGESLVFGRIRFFHDGKEYFPWRPDPFFTYQRHFWLLRLDRRAMSAELHPDEDGSLAIWMAPGDYALVGSTEKLRDMSSFREVVALLRVPTGPTAVHAGDLNISTESHEGGRWLHGTFGAMSVDSGDLAGASAALQAAYGQLPGPPASSPWCAGEHLPPFDDPALADRARALLDGGCIASP